MHAVLETVRPRELAEFYRRLIGLRYRPGDEPPADDSADDPEWLVLVDSGGARRLAVLHVDRLPPLADRQPRTTWPQHDFPWQSHVDLTVPDLAELRRQRGRAKALGAELLHDQAGSHAEPMYAFADPTGHPFCIFVA
nr:VOC family protein [Actinoplanes digitatis]